MQSEFLAVDLLMKNHASDSLIELTFYPILHRFLLVLWRLFNKIKNMSGYCSVSFDCTSVTIITCHSVTHFMLPEKQVWDLVWNQILVRAWEGFKCLFLSPVSPPFNRQPETETPLGRISFYAVPSSRFLSQQKDTVINHFLEKSYKSWIQKIDNTLCSTIFSDTDINGILY